MKELVIIEIVRSTGKYMGRAVCFLFGQIFLVIKLVQENGLGLVLERRMIGIERSVFFAAFSVSCA